MTCTWIRRPIARLTPLTRSSLFHRRKTKPIFNHPSVCTDGRFMRFSFTLICTQKSVILACFAAMMSLCVVLGGGCDGNDLPPDLPTAAPGPAKRVVSLAPSLTQMIHDLGAADMRAGS